MEHSKNKPYLVFDGNGKWIGQNENSPEKYNRFILFYRAIKAALINEEQSKTTVHFGTPLNEGGIPAGT